HPADDRHAEPVQLDGEGVTRQEPGAPEQAERVDGQVTDVHDRPELRERPGFPAGGCRDTSTAPRGSAPRTATGAASGPGCRDGAWDVTCPDRSATLLLRCPRFALQCDGDADRFASQTDGVKTPRLVPALSRRRLSCGEERAMGADATVFVFDYDRYVDDVV